MRIPTKTLALAALALFAILVAAGVHGLSIGCWDDRSLMPPDPGAPGHRVLGTPRWERADDWNVSVPQILAQCASPDFFPRVNPRVDLGRDMSVSTPCNPIWDLTAPAQPHNWGFFLLGVERAGGGLRGLKGGGQRSGPALAPLPAEERHAEVAGHAGRPGLRIEDFGASVQRRPEAQEDLLHDVLRVGPQTGGPDEFPGQGEDPGAHGGEFCVEILLHTHP